MDGECCSKYHRNSHMAITRNDVEHRLIVTKCLLRYAQKLLAEKNDCPTTDPKKKENSRHVGSP